MSDNSNFWMPWWAWLVPLLMVCIGLGFASTVVYFVGEFILAKILPFIS